MGSDIIGAFDRKDFGYFEDPEYPAVFADYKIPQFLLNAGILNYSEKLLKKIKEKTLIKAGSKEEIEIRSSTIWAVEYLKEELLKLGKIFCAFEIDWILWNKSQKTKMEIPYHLTKTIFY